MSIGRLSIKLASFPLPQMGKLSSGIDAWVHSIVGPAGVLLLDSEKCALLDVKTAQMLPKARLLGGGVATSDGFLGIQAWDGGATHIDAKGKARKVGGKKKRPKDIGGSGAAWDPDRGLVVFACGELKDQPQSTVHEWQDGAWRDLGASKDLRPRIAPSVAYVPPLRQMVLVGGHDKKADRFDDTAHYDGKNWTVFARAFPEVKDCAPCCLAFDPISSQLICVLKMADPPELEIFRYLGGGKWNPFARVSIAGLGDDTPGLGKAEVGLAGNRHLFFMTRSKQEGRRVGWVDVGSLLDGQQKTLWSGSAKSTRPLVAAGHKESARRPAFSMTFRKGFPQEGEDWIHGSAPSHIPAPKCKSCGEPMSLLAFFRSNPARLPLVRHTAVAIFQCENTRCAPWHPTKGGNAVILVDAPAAGGKSQLPKGEQAARRIVYSAAKVEQEPNDEEGLSPHGSKMGGYPTWVQGGGAAEGLRCSRCKSPMTFLAQLDSGDTGMNFGDCGIGFVLLCPNECGGSFLSQSG
jgi:hypothetical protein